MWFYNNLFRYRCGIALIVFLAFYVSQAAVQCLAQENTGTVADEKRIHITSDLLTTDNEKGYAKFSGNVQAVQGTTVIVSDELKVFYREDAGDGQKLSANPGAVEKIVASGNVKINFDDKTAVSEKAEYITDTQVVILSGENTKVTTVDESISGAKITLYRADGRVKVESGQGRRVEAIFYDSEK